MKLFLSKQNEFLNLCSQHSLEHNSFKRILNVFLLYNNLNKQYKKLSKPQKIDLFHHFEKIYYNMKQKKQNKYKSHNISKNVIIKWKSDYEKNKYNRLFQNIISNNSIQSLSKNKINYDRMNPTYNIKVSPHLSVTNQKNSGRCWIFAGLNILRRKICQQYNLDNFELSQNYIFFWDKLERMNYALENILKTKSLKNDSRMVQFLFSNSINDGGQWNMLVNIIQKYGLLPKSVYKETHHSESTTEMNALLETLFRNTAFQLRTCKSEQEQDIKQKALKKTYEILAKCLGIPPTVFNWSFENKNKKFYSFKNMTPLQFYKQFIKTNLDDYVCLVHDPRNRFYNLYTPSYLGNMVGKKIHYLNLPMKRIKELVIHSLKQNKAVWFGCDVGKDFNRNLTTMSSELVNKSELFDISNVLKKSDKLVYRDSSMTHAMIFTGVNIDESKQPKIIKGWEVENSWSKFGPNKGYYHMNPSWFDKYVYEIVIDKNLLNKKEHLLLYQPTIITLAPWDPMGALAQ